MKAMTGGIGLINFESSYNASKAYQMLVAYGEAGRMLHINAEIVDMFYIPIYTLFFSGILTFFFSMSLEVTSKWRKLNLLPFVVGAFDYAENIGIFTLLFSFPAQLTTVANITGILTTIKFTAATINLILPFFSIVLFIWHKVKKTRGSA